MKILLLRSCNIINNNFRNIGVYYTETNAQCDTHHSLCVRLSTRHSGNSQNTYDRRRTGVENIFACLCFYFIGPYFNKYSSVYNNTCRELHKSARSRSSHFLWHHEMDTQTVYASSVTVDAVGKRSTEKHLPKHKSHASKRQ